MRKRIFQQRTQITPPVDDHNWLELEELAQVELTSEDPAHPIESALKMTAGSGWHAQHPGQQTIRLLFDKPHRISCIHLAFQEDEWQRTQEFVLRWSQYGGVSNREIVRQLLPARSKTTPSTSIG